MTTFNDLYDIRSRSNVSKFAKKMIDAGFGDRVAIVVWGIASRHKRSKCYAKIVKVFGAENVERVSIVPVAKRWHKSQGTVNVIYLA